MIDWKIHFSFQLSLDGRNDEGVTSLLAATKNGQETCASLLLEHGASPDIVDPQTLLNVKELAENACLKSLVDKISLRNPCTQSRCSFPRQPDDDDMRSATRLVKHSESLECRKNRQPLLKKRQDDFEPKGTTIDRQSRRSLLPPGVCPSVPHIPSKPPLPPTSKDPFNLHDLNTVLSLYSEQQANTYRKGFTIPVMSTEEFQTYLNGVKAKVKPKLKRRPSSVRSSAMCFSPVFQERRRSAFSDPLYNSRRRSVNLTTLSNSWANQKPGFIRNSSDPIIDLSLQSKTHKGSRRHSLFAASHHKDETRKKY